MPDSPQFIHLHTHSAYSLAEGAITVEDLIGLCKKHKMPAVAVTDTNNLFGAMEFALYAAKSGVQPIIGTQIELGGEGCQIVLLAQNEEGYRNLCRLVSDAYLGGEEDGAARAALSRAALERHSAGLICLPGG